jgi:hypothetical protein
MGVERELGLASVRGARTDCFAATLRPARSLSEIRLDARGKLAHVLPIAFTSDLLTQLEPVAAEP